MAAIWAESSTRMRTETASPGMAGLENEKECGEVMLGRLLRESRKGPVERSRTRGQRGDMDAGGEKDDKANCIPL